MEKREANIMMKLNKAALIVIKTVFSILGISIAAIYLLNGVIAAFGFDATSPLEFATGAQGLYVINTLIGLLLLVVVGFGIFGVRRPLSIATISLVVLTIVGYWISRVGLGFSIMALVIAVLAWWLGYAEVE
jgi:Zn-dependent protease with chaperone function